VKPGLPPIPAGQSCRAPGSGGQCTYCGDGIVQTAAGESCDPPGSPLAGGGLCGPTCQPCGVQAGKQGKSGGRPFVDIGFVSNNEDGTASCLGWNAFIANGTSNAAESVTVQYVAKNTGGAGLFSCTVTDSNTAISSTAVSLGDVPQGGTSSPVPVT